MALTITNDGPAIRASNYWTSEYAARGAVYVSLNARAIRILVPDLLAEQLVAETRGSKYVILSRGPWPDQRRDDAIELLWEDGSSSPFALHVGVEQVDRLPAKDDEGRTDLQCTLWVRGADGAPSCAATWPARYRRVREIPALEPWGRR